jgi:serine/threonine protein kinase
VLAPAGAGQRRVEPAKPPPATAAALVELLRKHQLLTPPQLEQLTRNLVPRHPQPRALARVLLEKDWLTAFQVNQLLQGRGEELVLGPYLLLERLGEGGAGQVFKARHQRLNRLVALKVLHPELLGDADALSRFYREIKVCSQLDHPNIVRAHDAGPIGTRHYLAMEYIEGIDLARLVKQRGPLTASLAGEFVRQAALGLQYAHERGLIHRDIKPSNLVVTSRSRTVSSREVIKILDFGLARLRRPASGDGAVAGHTTITAVGSVVMMGTPDYLAPEQAINFHEADIRSDIYSLGCTCYYLLTGQPPFPGGTLSQKLWKYPMVQDHSLRCSLQLTELACNSQSDIRGQDWT